MKKDRKLLKPKRARRKPAHRFRSGDVLLCVKTGRTFEVYRVVHPDPELKFTYYLRSEAGHLGRPKNPWTIDLQIADGYLKHVPRSRRPKFDRRDLAPCEVSRTTASLDLFESP